MELVLQILLGLVTIICFLGGLNLLIEGVDSFLNETTSPLPVRCECPHRVKLIRKEILLC
jgi:hypothetical protein